MSKPVLDPVNVPVEWHRFLYRSVLLEWETVLHKQQFQRFDGKKLSAGIELVKMEDLSKLCEFLDSKEKTLKNKQFFAFYAKKEWIWRTF